MKIFYVLILVSLGLYAGAQTIADFENYDLQQDTFDNGSDGNGGFNSGGIFIPNLYDPGFDSWTGWSISTMRDTVTPGFFNQYSCIAAQGAQGTDTYAVSYIFAPTIIRLESGPGFIDSMYICNSTYAYLSMRDGDAFSKKFGGVSGEDPDFFRLTFKKYLNGVLSEDSVDFYLADFRVEHSSEDYIVGDWTAVDLSSLGEMDSLELYLASTDVGAFGINTPTYFCIDQISVRSSTTSATRIKPLSVSIFPNPVCDQLNIDLPSTGGYTLAIYSSRGIPFFRQSNFSDAQINVVDFPSGSYTLVLKDAKNRYLSTFLKF